MSNIETFNTIVGLVLADLYESFPVPQTLSSFIYAKKAGLVSEHFVTSAAIEAPVSGSIEWLLKEGFLRSTSPDLGKGYAEKCVLSQKGLQLLSIPEVLGKRESMGTRLSEAAKSGALDGLKELGKKVVCEGSKMLLEASIKAAMAP